MYPTHEIVHKALKHPHEIDTSLMKCPHEIVQPY